MVKINKIYTRTGDDGTTGLATGARVRKDHLRVECYGTVDEANAAIGVAVTVATMAHPRPERAVADRIAHVLRAVQHDLFDVGADLATPVAPDEKAGSHLRILHSQTERLERVIDEFNDHLKPLNSFVLPGGTPLAASLHVARTVVRRAERLAVSLQSNEPDATSIETVRYLNRVSDLLFVLGRAANDNGTLDVLWVPGATRGT
jgi:cob(I)alamin adenosyltransferase